MPRLRTLTALAAAAFAPAAWAQSPAQALADRIGDICDRAPNGSPLAQRCADIFASTDPQARLRAALGQRLDEIPGQVRVATRDIAVAFRGGRRAGSLDDGQQSFMAHGSSVTLLLDAQEDGDPADDALGSAWSLFFSADGGRLDRRAGSNEAGFDADTGSVTLGLDWQPDPAWQLGAAVNHAREDLDFTISDSVASTRFTGLLLTAQRSLDDTWSLGAYVGRYRGRYDLERAIRYSLPLAGGSVDFAAVARAQPDASRSLAGVSVDGRWSRAGWDWGFNTGIDQQDTRIEAYSETGGGGLDLAVPGRSVSTRRGRLDLQVGRTLSQAWGVFQPSIRLGLRQEFSDPRGPVTLRFVDDPGRTGISFDTEDPDRGWGEVAVGGVVTFTGGHGGFFELRQRVGHSFLKERMLAIGWRIEL